MVYIKLANSPVSSKILSSHPISAADTHTDGREEGLVVSAQNNNSTVFRHLTLAKTILLFTNDVHF